MKPTSIIVKLMTVACLTAVGMGGLRAQTSVTIINPSFEDPALSSGGYNGGNAAVPGWTGTGDSGGGSGVQYWTSSQFDTTSPLAAPASGNQALYINQGNSVYQDVGLLLADTTYTLTLAVGNRLDQPGGGIFELVNGTDNTGTVLQASTLDTPTPGTFNLQSISYTTGDVVSGDLTIDLINTVSDQVVFDNVQLTASAAPEPSTWILLLLGVGVLIKGYRTLRKV